MKTTVCPVCHGTGMRITDKEFFMEECDCVMIERIRHHVAELENSKILTSTPLLPLLVSNTSLIIEATDLDSVKCHIKTALVYDGRFLTFKIINPATLVDIAVTDQKILERTDLLVIESPVFLHYEKASQWHEFIMANRDALGKPTWFVVKGTLQSFKEAKAAYTPGFLKLLSSYKRVQINEKDTNKLIKHPNTTMMVNVNRGVGLVGVNVKLINFNPEIDKRLHDVKE